MTAKAQRILLAEDEVALRDFVSRNLRARGFEVLEASNELEAMALWERENPHLLILDIMMPRMDGLEVCRRVREHSTVPIIVLTALDAESDKVAALDLGAADYLTKPLGWKNSWPVCALYCAAHNGRRSRPQVEPSALVTLRLTFLVTSCGYREWRCGSLQSSSLY
jgi:CheY-like chemotaxis protein